jgi:hypothetical protein
MNGLLDKVTDRIISNINREIYKEDPSRQSIDDFMLPGIQFVLETLGTQSPVIDSPGPVQDPVTDKDPIQYIDSEKLRDTSVSFLAAYITNMRSMSSSDVDVDDVLYRSITSALNIQDDGNVGFNRILDDNLDWQETENPLVYSKYDHSDRGAFRGNDNNLEVDRDIANRIYDNISQLPE